MGRVHSWIELLLKREFPSTHTLQCRAPVPRQELPGTHGAEPKEQIGTRSGHKGLESEVLSAGPSSPVCVDTQGTHSGGPHTGS